MSRPEYAICENCAFWDEPTKQCREDSPTMNDQGFGVWPKTGEDDWCSHFTEQWKIEKYA